MQNLLLFRAAPELVPKLRQQCATVHLKFLHNCRKVHLVRALYVYFISIRMASASVEKPRYIKLTFYLKRLPGCTEEKFHRYWAQNHAQVAMEHDIFNKNVRRYNQYHIPPELKTAAAETGIPTLDCDGVAEIWVDSLESWKEVTSNIDFVKAIAADETHFLAQDRAILIGYDNLIIGKDVLS
ncbi:uncharacterized protein BDZ99DRAFT_274319 [Mytilinidion resinicola]|uniref:EthD domain-containing protein n=1 Tax=Mytilinidion resinicola TaxID=574789 RepID=A0A6A6YS80_9PEZI|nr:uncharacterized protein BDZ99DRAFT_274319 [Mytilinidion resinicola]KAF2811369.1 hypothetical protein BDZ99DRAFT_274319 [Mytilinidion resinicola]